MGKENKSFSFSYSGAVNDELEQLKEKYTKKEVNETMAEIRALDKRVDFITTMISIIIGIFGTAMLIVGFLKIVNGLYVLTIAVPQTVAGIVIMAIVPFIHYKIMNVVKNHYAPRILALIKEIEQPRL